MSDFYRQKGFDESSRLHGNPDLLIPFFDNIYQQLIFEPTHKDELNPELNQLEQEKSKLKEEIERITSKIDDIRKDEVKFREEKKAYEEKARLYDLENKKIKYNPKIYQTFQIAIILLLIIIILVYSIFFMHLFSSPTAKIFPPINE